MMINDAMERRALLLHLGDILEAISCVMKCGHRYNTIGEAYAQEETLASFIFLRQIDAEMTPHDFAKRAASAFFLWPKELLDEELNRKVIAHVVQHDLFAGHQSGWDNYVADLRATVPWFGDDLGPVPDPDLEPGVTIWPRPSAN
jgi:hypothetical protein